MRTGTTCAVLLAVLAPAACTIDEGPPPPADLGTFPYHPLVFELDLAVLAYQIHGQSMVWPIDPFYEEQAGSAGTPRDAFMALVRAWAARQGPRQVAAQAGLDAYRGPGVLAGLPDNPLHDPILYDYSRIHPWSHTITNNDDQWTEYLTSDAIVRRIRDVYVSARPIGGDGSTVVLAQVPPHRDDFDADATDMLCAFEGGTGDKGEPGQPASYSLMGFVLVRDTGGGSYDIHVNFRGSRSGSAFRSADEALSEEMAKGNPDWITDLGWDNVSVAAGAGDVTTVGGVHRGFARAMTYTLPGVFQCLEKAAELRGNAPTNIFITGHSLGGGLAQDFASAVLLGNTYGTGGAGPAMPPALAGWPWQQLKLVTFGSPRAGDYDWAVALSREALQSEVFDPGPIDTADADAHIVLDPDILARLHDTSRPAAFRVLISTDPISTTHFGGDGTHVGTTVYVDGSSYIDWIGVVNPDDHEPMNERKDIVDQLQGETIPPPSWQYQATTDLDPDRNDALAGTPAEMQKLADALLSYYANRAIYFDAARFTRDLELYFAIERGDAQRAGNRYPNVTSGIPMNAAR
jgi:hypothetical protein